MLRLRCQKKTKETTFCQNISFNHRWEVSPSEFFQTLCWQRWSLRITSFQRIGDRKGICKCIVQYQTHLSLPILMFAKKRSCFQLQWCWKNLPSELCPRWRVQSNNHCLVLASIRSHLRDDNDQCGVDRVFPAWRISYSCDCDVMWCRVQFWFSTKGGKFPFVSNFNQRVCIHILPKNDQALFWGWL